MIELLLKETNNEQTVYLYRPEGRGEYGEVIYIHKDKEAHEAKRASEDVAGRDAAKVCSKVEELISKGKTPEKYILAWY